MEELLSNNIKNAVFPPYLLLERKPIGTELPQRSRNFCLPNRSLFTQLNSLPFAATSDEASCCSVKLRDFFPSWTAKQSAMGSLLPEFNA